MLQPGAAFNVETWRFGLSLNWIGQSAVRGTPIGDRPCLRMGTDPGRALRVRGAQIGDRPEWHEVRFRMILLRRKDCRAQSLVEAFVLCPGGATELSPGFQP